MNTDRSGGRRSGRFMGAMLILAALLITLTGVNCDEAAKAVLVQSASSIADGLETIFSGLLDGIVAAVQSVAGSTGGTTS